MDAFGWSTQPPVTVPSCPTDDALLAAFLGAGSFEELHSTGAGDGTVCSDAYHGGLDLPSCRSDLSLLRCQDGVALPGHGDASSNAFLDPRSVGCFLPAIAGAHDGLHDGFEFVPDDPAQAAGSNTAFSGYSTTTCGGGGGGNVSSGESNTYGGGGHETEVASSPCAVSRPVQQISQVAPPPTKRNKMPDDTHRAAATTTVEARERWGTNRAAAPTTTSITFGHGGGRRGYEPDTEAIAQVKEMIYRAAAMRPIPSLAGAGEPPPSASPEPSSKPRRRKNVRISSDPQTVAARLRREKVSERLRALQRLVPGGSKMDTASMLDEAASYLKFLKSQVAALESLGSGGGGGGGGDDDGRYSSLQRYTGRNFNPSSRGSGGGGGSTMLAFGRDGVAGYVKSSRNMNMQL